MLASENGIINVQSERDIWKIMGNITAMWRTFFFKSKTTKNGISDYKDLKNIPSISYSKTKSQTTTMIRKDL